MTRTRKVTVAVAAALVLIVEARMSAHDETVAATEEREATIVLHVVNDAALSRDVLDKAKARVSMVYAGIGVRTVWVDSERPVRKHQDGGLHLTVILLSRDTAQQKISAESISGDVLGQAIRTHGRAYIFCERIATMSLGFVGSRLGGVIAHEVGHLLLPTNSHSRTGIMRANMDVRDVTSIPLQSFDKMQTHTIQTMLMGLTVDATRR